MIPCKGTPESLRTLLADLNAQKLEDLFEIIVVDAWSDDDIRQEAEAAGARVVRRGTGNLPGQARNLGAAGAAGEIVAFVDADCRVDPDWLPSAIKALDNGARLVAGPVEDVDPWHLVASADNLLQFADLPRNRPAGRMHMAPSCNLAIGKADFERLQGFRHAGGLATGEDVDFCQRAIEIWPDGIWFCPGMSIRHSGRRKVTDMIRHHHAFGYSRGRLKLLLSERQTRLASKAILAPAIVLRRLIYIFGRVIRLNPAKLPKTLLVSPFLIIGAVGWTAGFRRGLIESSVSRTDSDEATSPDLSL
ncbi:MAG: glycosyltransferase [Pseudomonadota bacterium]